MNNRSEVEDILAAGPKKRGRPASLLTSRHFWVLVVLIIVGILIHYPQQFLSIQSFNLLAFMGSERFTVERVYLLIPIVYGGVTFGLAGGTVSLAISLAVMLPRALVLSLHKPDALLEIGVIFTIGVMLNLWLLATRRSQRKREQTFQTLAVTRQELHQYVRAVENREKMLETINAVCLVASQFLDSQEVLEITAKKVCEVMDLEVTLIFLLNEETQELELKAYRGVSKEFAAGLRGLKVGEGFNGRVAESGQALLVADSASDARLTRDVVRQEGIHAQLIVPLKAKDRVVGTLSVAGRYARQFHEEEVDLLTTIGRQVGIAIENSQLYEAERILAEERKRMQEQLRFHLGQMTHAQEEERQRIAQELHDETIQDLILLLHKIDNFVATVGYLPPQQVLFLEELRQRISLTSSEVRRFTQDLRPSVLDDLGLLPALEWLISDVTKNYDIAIAMKVSGLRRRLPPETELVLFRIMQEALRNVWKHSQATSAQVTADFTGDGVSLSVSDNGKGFKVPERVEEFSTSGKLGMVGMQERAELIGASLSIKSQPGKGTTVTVTLPA